MTNKDITSNKKQIKILGIGNTLFSDEGVGVHLLDHLYEALPKADNIEIIEGATDGIKLLQYVEDADYLIMLDAINADEEPGTIIVLKDEDVPRYFGHNMSVHQMGVQDLVYASYLRDTLPDEMYLIGVQPKCLEIGFELTDVVQKCVPELVDIVIKQVEEWLTKS
jgi:hydrogenase maturation protease